MKGEERYIVVQRILGFVSAEGEGRAERRWPERPRRTDVALLIVWFGEVDLSWLGRRLGCGSEEGGLDALLRDGVGGSTNLCHASL